ncbi:unnamed protein product, partial [marine sediment metagenome]
QKRQIELREAEFMAQFGPEMALPGADVPIPEGAREGDIITRPDGSTFMWMRGPQGYPYPREISPAITETGLTPSQQAQIDIRQQEFEAEQAWRESQVEAEQRWRQQQLGWEQERFGAQQQQWQQQLQYQEQARLAQLAAQPQSWLQYAALAGTTPQIQPWMLPLMSQQYPELQAGGAIPGWMGTQETGQPMTTLPELLRPSAQYWGRMGPQAQQQYLGYRQARTGAIPEQAQWMQQGYAPPGGGRGLTYAR